MAGTQADSNDWRVTVRLPDDGQARDAAASLSTHSVAAEVHRRLGGRIAVGTGDGRELFLYAHSRDAAVAARESVSDLLSARGTHAEYSTERWHPVAEQWQPADVRLPATAAEVEAERRALDAEETRQSLQANIALFEVRVQLASHHEAVSLAEHLRAEGHSVVRRWRFLVVGANSAGQAEEFAAKIRAQAPAGAAVSTEQVGPGRPYTVFELAAGSGL